VTVSATDSGQQSFQQEFKIIVLNVNDRPTIEGNPESTIAEDSRFHFKPTATDEDQDTLSFAITNKPLWATFDSETGTLSGTPDNLHVGSYHNITISATDNLTTSTALVFDLNVTNTNDSPTAIALDNNTLTENKSGTSVGALTVTDSDDKKHTLTLSGPDANQFEITNGQLRLKTHISANYETKSNYKVTVSATDSGQQSFQQEFKIIVLNVNDRPTIEGNPESTIAEDSRFHFKPTATDEDQDTLSFAITNKPLWATFDSETGTLSGTPDNLHVGNYETKY